MINPNDCKIGMHVFYQQPHMLNPEYGVITKIGNILINYLESTAIFVRFFDETNSKACRAVDLHWPPNYCKHNP